MNNATYELVPSEAVDIILDSESEGLSSIPSKSTILLLPNSLWTELRRIPLSWFEKVQLVPGPKGED